MWSKKDLLKIKNVSVWSRSQSRMEPPFLAGTGAGADPTSSEPESAPGLRTSGAGAATSAKLNCSVSYNVNCKAVCCGFQKMTTGYGSRILPHFASERSENTCSKRISYIIKTKRIFFFQIVFFKNQLILRKNVPFEQWWNAAPSAPVSILYFPPFPIYICVDPDLYSDNGTHCCEVAGKDFFMGWKNVNKILSYSTEMIMNNFNKLYH